LSLFLIAKRTVNDVRIAHFHFVVRKSHVKKAFFTSNDSYVSTRSLRPKIILEINITIDSKKYRST